MRIFVASSDRVLRLALLLLLESEPGMVVIGMFDQAEGLLTIAKASNSEVYLLDYRLADPSTILDLIGSVHRLENSPKVIVLSPDPEIEPIALAAGADAFINKSSPPDRLLPLLRQMHPSKRTG